MPGSFAAARLSAPAYMPLQAPQPQGLVGSEDDRGHEQTFRYALAILHGDDIPRHIAAAETGRPGNGRNRHAQISEQPGTAR
eukprot:10499833-Heterocapsa_arctica.AAC.1